MVQPHTQLVSGAFSRGRTAPLALDGIAIKNGKDDVGVPGVNRKQHDAYKPPLQSKLLDGVRRQRILRLPRYGARHRCLLLG